MSKENAAMISGAVNYLLIDGQTKCLKTLQESDLVTIDPGIITKHLQDFIGTSGHQQRILYTNTGLLVITHRLIASLLPLITRLKLHQIGNLIVQVMSFPKILDFAQFDKTLAE